MPKDKAFSELSKKDQLSRAKGAKRAASMAEGTATSKKERARHQAAGRAASRVIGRLGEAPSSGDVTKPGKKGKTAPARRRESFEKATGTGSMKKKLEGVQALAKAAGK